MSALTKDSLVAMMAGTSQEPGILATLKSQGKEPVRDDSPFGWGYRAVQPDQAPAQPQAIQYPTQPTPGPTAAAIEAEAAKQRQVGVGAAGRASTFLTSGMGVLTPASTTKKSLLGQ